MIHKLNNGAHARIQMVFLQKRFQQYQSCLARNNYFCLIVNFGDIQRCNSSTDPRCPPYGRCQYTHIVYKNGNLVARYHKEHLYGESQFNKPYSTEYVYLDTTFDPFGVLICFETRFRDQAMVLVLDYNITNVVFPIAWIDSLPCLAAIQFHTAFAWASVKFACSKYAFAIYEGSRKWNSYTSLHFTVLLQ